MADYSQGYYTGPKKKSKLPSLIIFFVSGFFALSLIGAGLYVAWDQISFRDRAITVDATLLNRTCDSRQEERDDGTFTETVRVYDCDYQVSYTLVESNQPYQSAYKESFIDDLPGYEKGETIQIAYDPQSPKTIEAQHNIDKHSPWTMFFILLFFALMIPGLIGGVWGALLWPKDQK